MWQASGLNWEAFVPADRISDFIKDKKLDFLQGASNNTLPESGQLNQDKVTSDLVKIIKDGKNANADIHGYIKVILINLLTHPTWTKYFRIQV